MKKMAILIKKLLRFLAYFMGRTMTSMSRRAVSSVNAPTRDQQAGFWKTVRKIFAPGRVHKMRDGTRYQVGQNGNWIRIAREESK